MMEQAEQFDVVVIGGGPAGFSLRYEPPGWEHGLP